MQIRGKDTGPASCTHSFLICFLHVPGGGLDGVIPFAQNREQGSERQPGPHSNLAGTLLRLLAEAEGREGATPCSVSVTHDRKHFCERCACVVATLRHRGAFAPFP